MVRELIEAQVQVNIQNEVYTYTMSIIESITLSQWKTCKFIVLVDVNITL